jgi:serine/threonine protein kinase
MFARRSLKLDGLERAASVPTIEVDSESPSPRSMSHSKTSLRGLRLSDDEVRVGIGRSKLGEISSKQKRFFSSSRRSTFPEKASTSNRINEEENFELDELCSEPMASRGQKSSERTSKKKQEVSKGPPPSTQDKRRAITELIFHASVGALDYCQRIVKEYQIKVSDPNTADYDKRSPLHLAAAEGHLHVVLWLLAHKADPNVIDRFGRTSLEEAVKGDHGKIITLLLQHKAKVAGPNGNLIDLALSPLSEKVRGVEVVGGGSSFNPDWSINPREIHLMRKLSDGSHGSSFKAKWRGAIVAVKQLKNCDDINMGDMTRELNNMYNVHHPNTVQFLGAVISQKPYMIVYEFLSGGSVLDVIGSGGNFSQWRSLILAIDLAKGLDHLHNRQNPIIHGDLRPSNMLLGGPRVFNKYHKDLTTDEIGVVKITDFGLIRTLQKHNLVLEKNDEHLPERRIRANLALSMHVAGASTFGRISSIRNALENKKSMRRQDRHSTQDSFEAFPVVPQDTASGGEDGPLRYQAPEVYQREELTFASDVYSYGMILYHLFEVCPPFAHLTPEDAAKAASQGQRPAWEKTNLVGQTVSHKIKEIVEKCWHPVPTSRCDLPTIIDSLQDIASHLKPSVTTRNPTDEDNDEDVACCTCLG